MASSINYAILYIVTSVFNLYIMLLITRILLQVGRANPINPLTRLIISITKWPLGLGQHFLPTIKNIDTAIILVMLVTSCIKIYLITYIANGILLPNILGLIIWAIGDIGLQLMNLFFYAIIIQVIASWITMTTSPILEVVYYITAPIMKLCRRLTPTIGGLDISPVLAILMIKLIEILFIWNIISFGKLLSTT